MKLPHLHWFVFSAFWVIWGISAAALAHENIEVVLLIDVSGSMKQNDPQNLRVPAANFLINLLKNRATLTIFTFSTTTKLLVPTHEVNDEYENNFHARQKQINTEGQFTNILAALDAANKSWKKSKQRFIVLLTDGKIDRGSASKNSEDQDIINTQLLPEFKKNNIKIYPIGLGAGVDSELLNTLARQTNGIYQFIGSMADAEKSLYNAFTATIPAQGIPLEHKAASGVREVRIDNRVTQLSVIIEKKNQSAQITLSQPDGKPYDITNSNRLNQFIVIEVKSPTPGIWTLKGDEQLVERAIILTNLELITSKLSGEYFNRELITVAAQLKSEHDSEDLRKLLASTEVQLELNNKAGRFSTSLPLEQERLFKKVFILDMPEGITKSLITAKNASFMREEQSLFQIVPMPFKQEFTDKRVTFQLISPQITRDSVHISLVNQERNTLASLLQQEGVWQISMDELCKAQKSPSFSVHTEITATTIHGRQLTLVLPQQHLACTAIPIPLNNEAAVSLAQAAQSSAKATGKAPQLSAAPLRNHPRNVFLLLSVGGLIIFAAISAWFYKKNQRLYKEKMDELGGHNDI